MGAARRYGCGLVLALGGLLGTGCTPPAGGSNDAASGDDEASSLCVIDRATVELACLEYIEAQGGIPLCACSAGATDTCEWAAVVGLEASGEAAVFIGAACSTTLRAGQACCACADAVGCEE